MTSWPLYICFLIPDNSTAWLTRGRRNRRKPLPTPPGLPGGTAIICNLIALSHQITDFLINVFFFYFSTSVAFIAVALYPLFLPPIGSLFNYLLRTFNRVIHLLILFITRLDHLWYKSLLEAFHLLRTLLLLVKLTMNHVVVSDLTLLYGQHLSSIFDSVSGQEV